MMDKRIQTERLTLDVMKASDESALIEIFRHEKVKATYMLPDLEDDGKAHALFEGIRALSEREDRYVRGIYLDGRLIGVVNDTEILGQAIELGYAIHPSFHSRGFATEMLRAMINHLWSCGFEEIIAAAFEENIASIRVIQKCGMTPLPKLESIDYRGSAHNCVYFSIKRSDAGVNCPP